MTVLSRLGAIAAGQQHQATNRAASAGKETPFARYIESARTAERSARERIDRARKSKDKSEPTEELEDSPPVTNEAGGESDVKPAADGSKTIEPAPVALVALTGKPEQPIVVVGEATAVREVSEANASAPITRTDAVPAGESEGAAKGNTVVQTQGRGDGAIAEATTDLNATATEATPVFETVETDAAELDAGKVSVQSRPAKVEPNQGNKLGEVAAGTTKQEGEEAASISEADDSSESGQKSLRDRNAESTVLSEKIRLSHEQIKEGTGQQQGREAPASQRPSIRETLREEASAGPLISPDIATPKSKIVATPIADLVSAAGANDPATTIGKFLMGDDATVGNSSAAGQGASSGPVAPREISPSDTARTAVAASSETGVTDSGTARATSGPDLAGAARLLAASGSGGRWHTTLQLDPPSLGRMTLQIRMHDEAMTLRVSANTASVGRLVESRMDELRDALAVHGIRVERTEVVVRNEPANGNGSDAHARQSYPESRGDNSSNGYFGQSGGEYGTGGESHRWFGGGSDANNYSGNEAGYDTAARGPSEIDEHEWAGQHANGNRPVDFWA